MNNFVLLLFLLYLPLAESLEKEAPCDFFGQNQIYSKSYKFKNPLSFSTQINKWIEESLSHVQKNNQSQCPSSCKQINRYQVSSKIYPKSVIKGSCRGQQLKESYSFTKHFPYKKDRESMKMAHHKMTEWILSTFTYPFYSIPLLEPSQESVEKNVASACPSCSFYLKYNYKYSEEGQLDLQIKTFCGDKRQLLSTFVAEFVLFNNWSCSKK